MNARERFLAVMHFEPVDRTMLWEDGYWVGAVRRWYGEGLPKRYGMPPEAVDGGAAAGGSIPWDPTAWETIPDARDVNEHLGLDTGLRRIPVNNFVCPFFKEEVLEDHGEWILRRDRNGVLRRDLKDRTTLPDYVAWPVSNREDWERLKAERLRPTLDGRLPADWPARVEQYEDRDYPLVIGLRTGFYWACRDLLGDEQVLYTFYDDPALVHDIMTYLTDLWIAIYDQLLGQVEVDAAIIWEDVSCKTGPLISPAMVREFMLPCYQRFTGFLRDHGVDTVLVDSDGDCRRIIPVLLEGGVTGMMPFEVNAGMDVVAIREAFPRLQIWGGIDKTQLARGRDAIDRELAAKVTPDMLRRGGYIPHVDHQVPPDVSWENFRYYRERLNALLGASGRGGIR